MKTFKQALLDAANWLESNPERHIKSALAVTDGGMTCEPTSEKAECFCAIGRVVKELDITMTPEQRESRAGYEPLYNAIGNAMLKAGLEPRTSNLYGPNDDAEPWDVVPHCKYQGLSGPHSIANMRELAEKIK